MGRLASGEHGEHGKRGHHCCLQACEALGLLVSLAAHYRIVGKHATLLSGGARCARQVQATLRTDDAAAFARMGRVDADEAVGLGLASEVAEDAEERRLWARASSDRAFGNEGNASDDDDDIEIELGGAIVAGSRPRFDDDDDDDEGFV